MPTDTKDEKSLEQLAKKNSEDIASLTKNVDSLLTKIQQMRDPRHPNVSDVFGTPHIRQGEDPLNSRGFSFCKMIGALSGALSHEEAKNEIDIHNRLHQVFCKELGGAGYEYRGAGHSGVHRFLAPLATNFMQEKLVSREFRNEMKQMVIAGCDGADHGHTTWMKKKLIRERYGNKALSWLNELTGGALVAPPEMGELIELLRNKEALINAGARTVPLPPQGRMKYPRQTAASMTYWIGENAPITESSIGTGEVTLQAKKLAVLLKVPNELIRFASPAAEALLRDDMTKSLALGLDLAGLEGAGGDHRPLGLINMANINRVTSSSAAANGDTIVGPDLYRMIASVEESNAEFQGWIMRPKTLYKYYRLRSDAVSAGDQAGPFLFNLIREASDGVAATLASYPVTTSTQVSQTRSKGNASNLSYVIGGRWDDLLIGMFGAIEFATTTLGDTSFVNDQTWVRGILSADIAARHESAFTMMDSLLTN